MRRMIVVTMLLTFCTGAFAAQKNVKPQPPSTGIVIANFFNFFIEGDGITTTFTFNPRKVPPTYLNGTASLPKLPLAGVDNFNAHCLGGSNEAFTGTISNGLLTVNFATAPPANEFQQCSVVLLFQPE